MELSLIDVAVPLAIATISPNSPLRSQTRPGPSTPPKAALASDELNNTLVSLVALSSWLKRRPAVSCRRSEKS